MDVAVAVVGAFVAVVEDVVVVEVDVVVDVATAVFEDVLVNVDV